MLNFKKSIFAALCALCLFAACQNNTTTKAAETKTLVSTVSDSAAISESLRAFYTWYDANSQRLGAINFTNNKSAHTSLDENQLQLYLAEIKKSGLVSDELIADETKFFHACAKLWQNEPSDEPNSGLEADRFLCAQDYIAPYNTGVVSSVINGDRAQSTLTLKGSMPGETNNFNFEMKKENGKWLLAKLGCDMGVNY